MGILDDQSLVQLLSKLHDERGLDFSQYKESMLRRRIERQLRRHELSSYDEYYRYIENHPDELAELIDSLSIKVTEFFRNPESFEAIDEVVVPGVIHSKQQRNHKIIRCWSCGCSLGDEPYSLAILLLRHLGKLRDRYAVTVCGTDIDIQAVAEARNVNYDENRLKDIDIQLREEFFEDIGNSRCRPIKEVRDVVKFRYLDIIKDQPLLHCDIILCRNVLIYFNKQLQEEVLLKLFESLNPGGYLVLGMVESMIGAANDRFEVVDNRLRIYRRPDYVDENKVGKMMTQDEIDKLVREIVE